MVLIVFFFSFKAGICFSPADTITQKELLLKHTIPMANIFQDHKVYAGVSLNQVIISADSVKFSLDGNNYEFHYRGIGANFSQISGISRRLNIYTQDHQVFYIESFGFLEQYSFRGGIGSHFHANANITDFHLTGSYAFEKERELGLEIAQLFDWQQTDLHFFYQQAFWKIASVKTGIGVHYLAGDLELSDRYTFPDDDLSFRLDASFFQTLFIEPGITFQAGRFFIHQGIRCNAVILSGRQKGIAYQIRPILSLDYRFF
ncbi:MAG: hypothetical protein ACLFQM_11040 [Fidelibacterota bacterium]